MGYFFCLVVFVLALWATHRSLGAGLSVLLATGYFFGIARAHFYDTATHFLFDIASAGVYIGYLSSKNIAKTASQTGRMKAWLIALSIWPALTILYSPFIDSQPFLIQLVGLRAAVFFLPFAVLGTRLVEEDMRTIALALCVLNLVAFVVGLLEYQFGIDTFIPQTEQTQFIFLASDVGEEHNFRIPSTFMSSHAFGGTMVLSIPFISWYLERLRGWRSWLVAGVFGITVLSVFMAAARSPVIQLGLMVVGTLLTTRPSMKRILGLLVIAVVVGYIVYETPRFQRFMTLSDTDYVSERVGGGKLDFLAVLERYPFGVGLGGAFGTSIPSFLADMAHPTIGIESEFGRIALEQSIFGLLLWIAFVFWALTRPPKPGQLLQGTARRLMALCIVAMWISAFIGAGLLAAMPGSAIIFLQMGLVAAEPQMQEQEEEEDEAEEEEKGKGRRLGAEATA